MRLQVIHDNKGKTTGVYIPIAEWKESKKQYKLPEISEQEEPTKEQLLMELKEAVNELKLIETGKLKARPAQELLDKLEQIKINREKTRAATEEAKKLEAVNESETFAQSVAVMIEFFRSIDLEKIKKQIEVWNMFNIEKSEIENKATKDVTEHMANFFSVAYKKSATKLSILYEKIAIAQAKKFTAESDNTDDATERKNKILIQLTNILNTRPKLVQAVLAGLGIAAFSFGANALLKINRAQKENTDTMELYAEPTFQPVNSADSILFCSIPKLLR